MSVERESAASSLADIESVERRTFEAIFSGIASSLLFLWGGLTAAGYVFTQLYPRHAGSAWMVLQAAGFVAMLAIIRWTGRLLTPRQRLLGWRLAAAQIVLIAFGVLVVQLLGPFNARQFNAFWPLVFMLGYVLLGLWVGRFFILCGSVVALLTMAGYWWSGPWFALWMAAVQGSALTLGGWWLRRRGAAL